MRLTDASLTWLRQLAHQPGSKRRIGPVGYRCMIAGWSEWNYLDIKTGLPITEDDARAKYGDRWFNKAAPIGERLTERGRWVLRHGRIGEDYSNEPR